MTAAALVCGSCGTELSEKAEFCSECGAAVSSAPEPAEYNQVTVLFADVVHSMDIAAAVGAERLREIMAGLVDRAAVVVQHFGGTVDKFTGVSRWQIWPGGRMCPRASLKALDKLRVAGQLDRTKLKGEERFG